MRPSYVARDFRAANEIFVIVYQAAAVFNFDAELVERRAELFKFVVRKNRHVRNILVENFYAEFVESFSVVRTFKVRAASNFVELLDAENFFAVNFFVRHFKNFLSINLFSSTYMLKFQKY